jgi:hypothetical protein
MAITDIDISETLEAGAPSIKYTGNRDPNMQMASASDAQQQEADRLWQLELKKMGLDEDYIPEIIDPEEMKVASDPDWESEWEDLYQNYKIKQIKLNQEFVTKEEFMEDYQNNMASGGRVNFGLGSIFKSIKKGVKKLAKSPIGKLGIGALAMGAPFGGGNWFGAGSGWGKMSPFLFGNPDLGGVHNTATKGILSNIIPKSTMGKAALAGGIGLTAASAFEGMEEDDVKALRNNPEALRGHLEQYYRNVNSEALKNQTMTDEDVTTWVETQMYSTGGRVGLRDGSNDMTISTSQNDPRNMTTIEIISIIKEGRSTPEMFQELRLRGIKGVDEIELAEGQGDVGYSFDERLVDEYNPKTGTAEESFLFKMRRNNPEVYGKYEEPQKYPEAGPTIMDKHYLEAGPSAEPKWMKAKGGRIGFAYGPDQTAEAAGIMGQLPVRNNGAGVKELDLRDSGGFIPPVGVKEKADDIPAMLSNNEFVMTADAVRAAGGGSVEKGAQVMYDQMKNLESKVV